MAIRQIMVAVKNEIRPASSKCGPSPPPEEDHVDERAEGDRLPMTAGIPDVTL
jgi:hypothetical protein